LKLWDALFSDVEQVRRKSASRGPQRAVSSAMEWPSRPRALRTRWRSLKACGIWASDEGNNCRQSYEQGGSGFVHENGQALHAATVARAPWRCQRFVRVEILTLLPQRLTLTKK
jgi:hypothetical protein